ncbi:MAG: arginine--tRNA ligase [Moraxellaceae bacterium]|nr:MAG: arginine--tRNA ligase [Moraxellaceae bacterium]
MKAQLEQLVSQAIKQLQSEAILPEDLEFRVIFQNTKDKSHGDIATNIALMLAKKVGLKPRDLAEKIIPHLRGHDALDKVELAGPGFINFFIKASNQNQVIGSILSQQREFGRSQLGNNKKVQIEYVSANPTGPLHVGHGRGAAYGATLANLLTATGHDVQREYYVNDAGRQMNILAASVWLRYLELSGESIVFPRNGYQGGYVHDIAKTLLEQHQQRFVVSAETVFANLPLDEQEDGSGDKEAHIDGLIEAAQTLLKADYECVFNAGLDEILADIRQDLQEFGVEYDQWFSEKSLSQNSAVDSAADSVVNNAVDTAIKELQQNDHIYTQAESDQPNTLWFRSTAFGDDKDRVVQRENGQGTYFASDIAYHREKFQRGFDQVINIWGADHHGYITRVKASLSALNIDPDKLTVRLVQFAILYRGKERVQMSTRSGSFVTLRELRNEVGNDAARFFYVTRKVEQHMDFDLELAKSQTKDNPVYYIQYAHARVCSVARKLKEQGLEFDQPQGLAQLALLSSEHEKALMKKLTQYPELLEKAAINYEPHSLANYLKELAGDFHAYYNANKVLVDDSELRNARISLSLAVKQVIANGLEIIGVSAPESM